MIGHALLAPPNSRLVIDEPELHLHESIQSMLWDALESARQDCVFIYITHDLGIAASRVLATKLVLYDYSAPATPDTVGHWNWDLVSRMEELPEDIVLRILGSRRPTIFVEGLTGSVDQQLYETLWPDQYVVPSGDCEAVVGAVRVFRQQSALHHLSVSGLIDRDDRRENEVATLETKGIYVLPFGAVENFLVLHECLVVYAASLGFEEADALSRIHEANVE